MTLYGMQKQIFGEFDAVVTQVKDALTNEGFGVLSEIDVAQTLKKKLNVNFPKYVILGACHAPSAYQILKKEPSIGLLLPCNVLVHQTGETVTIEAIRPSIVMKTVENPTIVPIAKDVEEKLQRVIAAM